jgi:hypothetical protein
VAYVSQCFDELRALLADPNDAKLSFDTKKLFLNRGIDRLWPRLWRVTETGYYLPAGERMVNLGGDDRRGRIIGVWWEDHTGQRYRIGRFDVIAGDEDQNAALRLAGPVSASTAQTVYVRAAVPIVQIGAASYVAAQSEVWTGPDKAIELPVFWAMGLAAMRRLDDRQAFSRYSTTRALNGVDDRDIVDASSYWFSEFWRGVAELEVPLPPTTD